MKGKNRNSVFPVKLFITYVLSLTFCIVAGDSPYYDMQLAYCLALCPALFIVIFLIVWNFRSMPIFSIGAGSIALFLAIFDRYDPSRLTDYSINFGPLAGFSASLAVPFIIIYLIWRFWPRKQAGGLPAS